MHSHVFLMGGKDPVITKE